jgi:hypothetical protein
MRNPIKVPTAPITIRNGTTHSGMQIEIQQRSQPRLSMHTARPEDVGVDNIQVEADLNLFIFRDS